MNTPVEKDTFSKPKPKQTNEFSKPKINKFLKPKPVNKVTLILIIIYIFSFQTGETAEKKSIPSTSSFEKIQGYLGDGESSTSLSSLHFLNVEDTFEDQQTTPESMSGEEPDTCQTTGKRQ